MQPADHPVPDAQVRAAVDEALARDAERYPWDPDPRAHKEHGYPLSVQQGEFLYLLVRATGATRIVEFATSIGISTMYLAAAVRDNGGGLVIGSEIVPEKVARARQSVAAAGLADVVDIREGDALETLRDVDGPIDMLLLDGWPTGSLPSIDRRVLDLIAPKLRVGGVVFDDNGEADVLELLRAPGGAFRALTLPFSRSESELAVRVA